jgi:hypothetical protein
MLGLGRALTAHVAGHFAPGHAEFNFSIEQLGVKIECFFTISIKVQMWC